MSGEEKGPRECEGRGRHQGLRLLTPDQRRPNLLSPLPPPGPAAPPPPGFPYLPATELKTLPDWSAHVKRLRSSLTVHEESFIYTCTA